MNLLPIALLLVGGIILTAGDVVMKKWVGNNSPYFYIAGLSVYFVGLNFLAWSYKYKNIAVASTMLVLFNIITLAILSWAYFKEKLSTFEIIGILLGITSIFFLELASAK